MPRRAGGIFIGISMIQRMKIIKLFIVVTALILLAKPLFAFANNSFRKDQLDSFLTDAVKRYKIPGLTVAVVDGKGVLHHFCSGQTNTHAPITPKTPFLLGSTSKTFTALAVMRLVESGKIDLDEPIKTYLSDFHIQNHDYENQITVRHLLNHTSGLSGKDLSGYSIGADNLTEELIPIRRCNPHFAPGTHYEYFNSNYRVLGLLIERISGMSFGKFIKQEIFEPLSMYSSSADTNVYNDIIQGYGQFLGFPYKRTQELKAGGIPSGYMTSSTADISRFLIEELKAVNQESTWIDKETVVKSWTAPDEKDEGYAMGWLSVKDSTGNHAVVHGGTLENFQSFFYLSPNKQIGFVILMNQGGLLPMIEFSKIIRDGVLSIIENREPRIETNMFPLIATLLLSLVILLCILRIRRLTKQPPSSVTLKRKMGIILDFFSVAFILWGFIPLMNSIMGDKADWCLIYSMLPEFCLLLLIICVCNILCGVLKIRNSY